MCVINACMLEVILLPWLAGLLKSYRELLE